MSKTTQAINIGRRESAAMLGFSLPTFDALCRRAENPIPFFRVGYKGNKKILCPVEGLRKWSEEEAERQRKEGA